MNLRTEEGREQALLTAAVWSPLVAVVVGPTVGMGSGTAAWCVAVGFTAVAVGLLCAVLAVLNLGSDERRAARLAEKTEAARARLRQALERRNALR